MNYKNHILVGTIFSLFFIIFYGHFIKVDNIILFYIINYPIIIFYSLLPDVDIGTSIIHRFINTVALLLIIIFALLSYYNDTKYLLIITIIALSLLLIGQLKHRGLSHNYFIAFALSSPLLLVNNLTFCLAFVSIISHIIVD